MSWNIPGMCTMAVFTVINIVHAALLFTVFSHTVHGETLNALFNGHTQAVAWVDFVLNSLTLFGIIAPLAAFLTPNRIRGLVPVFAVFFTSLLAKVIGLLCLALTNHSYYTIAQTAFVSLTVVQLLFGVFCIRLVKSDYRIFNEPSSNSGNSQPEEVDCPTPSTAAASINTAYDANKEFPV